MGHLQTLAPIVLTPQKKPLPLPLQILTSPKTTAALGGILGALLFFPTAVAAAAAAAVKAAPRVISKVPKTLFGTPKRTFTTLITAPTIATVLAKSPRARGIVKTIFDPRETVKRGTGIAEFIEDPAKATRSLTGATTGEKIRAGLKKAGVIGGVAAVVGAGAVGVAKVVKRLKKPKVPKIPSGVIPSGLPPIAFLPAPPSITSITAPIGAVEKPIEQEILAPTAPVSMPSIKITNKPSINISFRKSRRFINQQVLISNNGKRRKR